MTAHATIEERQRCLEEGMVDHVSKPIDPELLIRTVARLPRGIEAWGTRAAAPRAQGAAPHAADLGPIPGLDTADGLRRLGGNDALYRKLLAKLAAEQRDAASRIAELLAVVRSRGRVAARAHAEGRRRQPRGEGRAGVRGGARGGALRRRRARGASEALVAELDGRLASLVGPLSAALAEGEPAPAAAIVADPSRAAAVLSQLRAQLSEFDSAAADTLEANRGALGAVLAPDALALLDDAVGRYAFDEALARPRPGRARELRNP